MIDWRVLIQKFRSARLLVVGDVCLDRWCRYDPREADVSRETGIPRIGVVKTEVSPGAGGTIAANAASLGAKKVSVLGAIGQDGFGFELERALSARGIDYGLVVASPRIQTFTYTKVINEETRVEDRPRIDFINTEALPSEVEDQLIANFHSIYKDYDAIVISDQAETAEGGVITPAFREVLADVAERNPELVVVVDSRTRLHHFRNAIAKPNRSEADAASRILFGEVDYQRLREALGGRDLIITCGGDGVLVVTANGERTVPAAPIGEPVDLCGAGDSFAAGAALALQAGADIETAARFGVIVAGVTVTKHGTGVATVNEVLAAADTLAMSD